MDESGLFGSFFIYIYKKITTKFSYRCILKERG